MSTSKLLAMALLMSVHGGPVYAFDLELTIRPHTKQVIFGDPLYVEVTILNRGKEIISAPNPSLSHSTFDFLVYDPETQLTKSVGIVGHGFGDAGKVEYKPGEPRKHYWKVFLPGLGQVRHPFWDPLRGGRGIMIRGVYYLGERVSVATNSEDILIQPRSQEDLEHLERWFIAKVGSTTGPSPNDFGVHLKSSLNREQTLQALGPMRPSELADLFQLTTRLQEIYESKAELREPHERQLVEWLEEQPRAKRLALSKEVANLAHSYNLTTTAAAVEKIFKGP